MQSFINGFLKPPIVSNNNSPVIRIGETTVIRKDYTYCMINISVYTTKKQETKRTILYCHSFGSSKYEAESILEQCVKRKLKLVTFSFKKVGSNGEIDDNNGVVTFGYKEAEQVQIVLDWIEQQKLGEVILWGRSMGAVACLRSQLLKPTVSGIILDSPYESLKAAIFEMIYQHTTIPNFLAQGVYGFFKPTIQQNLGFKIQSLDLGISLTQSLNFQIPCIFIASKSDKLFGRATQNLYSKYKSLKQLFFTQNSHNAPRQQHIKQLVLKNILCMIQTNERQRSRKYQVSKSKQTKASITSSTTTNTNNQYSITDLKLDLIGCKRKKYQIDPAPELKVINCFGFCSMT